MSAKNLSRRVVTNAPLRDVVIFTLPITLWSGRGKLDSDDLGIDASLLPPVALATLGSKRLIDRDSLKPLERIKRQMIRVLASHGLRFLSGYAHAHETAKNVAAQLNRLVKQGEAAKEEFLNNFDTKALAWQEANPNWAHIIRASIPTRERIAGRITFGWQCMVADTPKDKELADKLTSEASGLAGTLWAEVEAEAYDFVTKSFVGARNTATQRTVKPIRRLVEKLDRLSFLDHRVSPLVDVLEVVIATLPTTGKLSDQGYVTLVQLGSIMSRAERMQCLGQQIFDGKSVQAAADEITGGSLPAQDLGLSGTAASLPVAIAAPAGTPVADDADGFFDEESDDVPARAPAPAPTKSVPRATRRTAKAERAPVEVSEAMVAVSLPRAKPFTLNF